MTRRFESGRVLETAPTLRDAAARVPVVSRAGHPTGESPPATGVTVGPNWY